MLLNMYTRCGVGPLLQPSFVTMRSFLCCSSLSKQDAALPCCNLCQPGWLRCYSLPLARPLSSRVTCCDSTHLSLSNMASHRRSTSPAAAAAASAAAAVAIAGAPPLLLARGLLGGATSSQPAWLLRASSSCRPVPAWLDHARTCNTDQCHVRHPLSALHVP